MSKHTPGKWHAVDPRGAFDAKWVIVTEGRDDAIVASVGGDMPEEDANAALLAAAPELLEALMDTEPLCMALCTVAMLDVFEDQLPYGMKARVQQWLAHNRAQAAIKKANGE